MAGLSIYSYQISASLPVVNSTGVDLGGTFHIVQDSIAVPLGAPGVVVVTLTGNTAYTSATSYAVFYSFDSNPAVFYLLPANLSASSFQFDNNDTVKHTIFYTCIGS